MSAQFTLKHQFVEFIPEQLAERTLYISIRFATISHLCCCGCKSKVVTPLQPTDWKLIFDGKTISLYPSVGNWSFACRSHYWIRNNTVEWCGAWPDEEVAAGRNRDRWEKERHFGVEHPVVPPSNTNNSSTPERAGEAEDKGLWWRLRKWWSP